MTHTRTLALALHLSMDPLPAWRRLQVPRTLPLGLLHQVLQLAFDWGDARSHVFYRRVGQVLHAIDPEAEQHTPISSVLSGAGRVLPYVYDPGAGDWTVDIRSEGLVPALHPDRIAFCTGGDGRSPPEGCGGFGAYLLMIDPEPEGDPLAEEADASSRDDGASAEAPPLLKKWSEPVLEAHFGPAFHPDLLNARLTDPAFTGELERRSGPNAALRERLREALHRAEVRGPGPEDLELAQALLEACPSRTVLVSQGDADHGVLDWLRDTLSVAADDPRAVPLCEQLARMTGAFTDGFRQALAVARHQGTEAGLRVLEVWRDQALKLGDPMELHATAAFLPFLGGDAAEAEARLRRLIAAEPDPCVREPAVERLVTVLDHTGRKQEAQRLYEDESDAVLDRLELGVGVSVAAEP